MVRKIGLIALAIPLLYLAVMMSASELVEEVVVLHTTDDRGSHPTSLWIVEDELGNPWLRAGMPDSGWLKRIEANPDVELVREGRVQRYRAVPVPEQRERIHRLMRERYGWSDRIVGALRDGSGSIPVRLDQP